MLLQLSFYCFVLVFYSSWVLWSGKVYQPKSSFPPSVWQIFRYLQSLVVVNVTVPERESSTLVETYIRSI